MGDSLIHSLNDYFLTKSNERSKKSDDIICVEKSRQPQERKCLVFF